MLRGKTISQQATRVRNNVLKGDWAKKKRQQVLTNVVRRVLAVTKKYISSVAALTFHQITPSTEETNAIWKYVHL